MKNNKIYNRSRSERDYEETTSEDPHDREGDAESILEGIDEERERIEEEQRIEEEEEEESHQRNHIGTYGSFFSYHSRYLYKFAKIYVTVFSLL